MLLEAAMEELRPDAPTTSSPPQPAKAEIDPELEVSNTHNIKARRPAERLETIVVARSDVEKPFFKDDAASKDGFSDEFSSNNASSSLSTSFCDDSSEGLSLIQDDNEFASRVLNREPSNLGESHRFGGYRSPAMATGGVPFQWESQPGKAKDTASIKEEEEEQVAPLGLPPFRVASPSQIPPYASPSRSSATSSPSSITGKVKNLLMNHVKKPSVDHFSFSIRLDTQKSPSRSLQLGSKNRRKRSSWSSFGHSSVPSSPSDIPPHATTEKVMHVQRNEELYVSRTSVNSSDPSSSPYYFSPLSNSSSYISQGTMSPRASTARSSNTARPINSHNTFTAGGRRKSSAASIGTVSNISLSDNENTSDPQNGHGFSSSFVSPEMEFLDDEQLVPDVYTVDVQKDSKTETTMDEFINRGSGAMNRSLSTSRVTFSDGRDTQTKNKSRYYSAQLNAHGESKTLEGSIDTKIYNTKLDVLFPLRKPNSSGILTPQRINQMDESPGDRPAYADALDTSLDCSDITDNEQLNSMMQTIMKVKPPNDLPAHEVVMQANDDNGFAYSPIASAFVFSPTKDSHCATRHYLQPSSLGKIGHGILNSRAKCGNEDQNQKVIQQPKSILKNAQYHELQRTQSLSVRTGNGSQTAPFPPCIQQSKSLNHSSSQKISSVLLRFAEAEERHFNPKKQHQHHGIRAPACIQPMCSFLGRALLCRTKLTSHSSWGHP